MNLYKKIIFSLLIFSFFSCLKVAAQGNLGGKDEYIIIKDYKPVLAESNKISDSPEADTSSSSPPVMKYNITPKKIETNYEAGVIKAVKLKDEPITKLYRSMVKLGIGNYSTYHGELFVNSLRSKTGSLGLHLKHFSASPHLNDVGDASFSENMGSLYGKYFLDHSTFSGDVNYSRDVVHYYGYNVNDPLLRLIFQDADNTKQRFNNFGLNLGLKSNYVSKGNLDYDFRFHFNTISDLFSVTENDFIVSGTVGKKIDANYFSVLASFDYFNKTRANFEKIALDSDLNRNIINVQPQFTVDNEDFHLLLGLGLAMEKNLSTLVHAFPKAELSIPIAEHVLTAYAGIDGNIVKNNYKTITDENPFATSAVRPLNTINKLIITGGLKANFSNTISFNAAVNYSKVKDMQFYYNDTSLVLNRFNVLYDDVDVLNVHTEVTYAQNEKLNISLHVDLNKYTPDAELKAWHKPNSIVSIVAKYNLNDKLLADVSLFSHGVQYARTMDSIVVVPQKINGYVDFNLGLEYRYTKILSFYVHLNNLGFSRYYLWNQYPSERFNIMGGLTYAF